MKHRGRRGRRVQRGSGRELENLLNVKLFGGDLRCCRSWPHAPKARTRTSTSPARGHGICRSASLIWCGGVSACHGIAKSRRARTHTRVRAVPCRRLRQSSPPGAAVRRCQHWRAHERRARLPRHCGGNRAALQPPYLLAQLGHPRGPVGFVPRWARSSLHLTVLHFVFFDKVRGLTEMQSKRSVVKIMFS